MKLSDEDLVKLIEDSLCSQDFYSLETILTAAVPFWIGEKINCEIRVTHKAPSPDDAESGAFIIECGLSVDHPQDVWDLSQQVAYRLAGLRHQGHPVFTHINVKVETSVHINQSHL